ncbi:hypothetical protein EMIT0P43_10006 [Pseudomonas jessenii]
MASTLIARYRRVRRVISRQAGLTDIPEFYSLACSPGGPGDTAGLKVLGPHDTVVAGHSKVRKCDYTHSTFAAYRAEPDADWPGNGCRSTQNPDSCCRAGQSQQGLGSSSHRATGT